MAFSCPYAHAGRSGVVQVLSRTENLLLESTGLCTDLDALRHRGRTEVEATSEGLSTQYTVFMWNFKANVGVQQATNRSSDYTVIGVETTAEGSARRLVM